MRPLRILLVEDDVLIGALLAEMLAEMGYSVCSVETTEAAAVNTALVARPDLMIVDAHLGSGSGIAAVETIFKTLAIPHIFVSGDRISTGRASTIVLQKPFKQQDLLQAIEQTIDTATKARVVCVQELDPMQHYHSVAAGRRAVRDYTAVPVDEQTIGLLIADAVQAPSAIDEQPWAFTVVRDQALLDRASSEAKAHMLATTPAGALPSHFTSRLDESNFQIFYHAPVLVLISAATEGIWVVEDCTLAAENLMLAAYAVGLGSCWIGSALSYLKTPQGRSAFGLPRAWEPVAPIILGHPKSVTSPVARKAPAIHWLG